MRHAGVWYAASCRGGGGIRGASGSLRSPLPTHREGMRVDGPLIAFPGPARLHLGPPTCVGGAGDQAGPPPTRQPWRGPPEGPGQRRPRRQVAGSRPSLRHAFHRPATCLPAAAAPRGQTAALPACAAGARPLSGESALRVRRAVGLAPPRRAAAQGDGSGPSASHWGPPASPCLPWAPQ